MSVGLVCPTRLLNDAAIDVLPFGAGAGLIGCRSHCQRNSPSPDQPDLPRSKFFNQIHTWRRINFHENATDARDSNAMYSGVCAFATSTIVSTSRILRAGETNIRQASRASRAMYRQVITKWPLDAFISSVAMFESPTISH